MDGDRKHTFRIDMNALDGDEIGTLLLHASDPARAQLYPPARDDIVGVIDEDGDRWDARVVAIDGIWLGLEIDWDSWQPNIAFDQPASTGGYRVSGFDAELPTRGFEPITSAAA